MFGFFIPLLRLFHGMRGGLRDPEFQGLGIFVIILLFTGTIFYFEVEHWSLLDSLYFSVTTLATVGFGDLTPKTEIGKAFTILYIFVGVGTLLSFLALLAHHAKEQDPLHKKIVDWSESRDEH